MSIFIPFLVNDLPQRFKIHGQFRLIVLYNRIQEEESIVCGETDLVLLYIFYFFL